MACLMGVNTSKTVDASIFGGSWYSSDEAWTTKPKVDDKSFEWNIPNTHFENNGFVKHFKAQKLEKGTTVKFKMGWNSYGSYTPDCPHKKVGGAEKVRYDCYKSDKIVEGCRWQVSCVRDTGDFRIVIADSNGQKLTKNGFGSLEKASNTGKWQGIEWRFIPHGPKKFSRPSKKDSQNLAMPSHVMTKFSPDSSVPFFNTKFGHR